ncbi:hypothetical protein BHE74_00004059 [Ensete ventricosum]|nr:hypothetical protein BHE74_00004059 [Ensete ventricosum]
MMSWPGEVTRVRKVASVVWRHDSVISTLSRFLCKRLMRPSCEKTRIELLVLDRAHPTIKSRVGLIKSDFVSVRDPQMGYCRLVDPSHSLCHAASRLLSVVLQADRLVAFALSCRQSPAVRGAAGWSARHVCFTMSPAALSTARCQVRCGSIGTPNLPVDLTEVG